MSLNAYVGLQGSGKSYEVVSGPIVEAVAAGRRVVTNVAGIDQDLIHDYLVKKRDADPDKLGSIVHVTNDRVLEPQFFPDEEKPDLESVVKGGDLVAIDEAWRCWGTDKKLSHEHMQFFRMHRHYVHPDTNVTCDIILMTQDITGLHRSVKNVVEFTFRMQKHKSLGLNTRYRVDIFDGSKLTAKTRIDSHQKKYDKEVFPLYQSYTGGKGQEKAIDSRQNIFANRTLWVMVVVMIAVGVISVYFIWRYFHPVSKGASKIDSTSVPVAASAQGSAAGQVATGTKVAATDAWRVVGDYYASGERWVVVANSAGRLRVVSPSVFYGEGQAVIGDVDGEKVTRWSGVSGERVNGGMHLEGK